MRGQIGNEVIEINLEPFSRVGNEKCILLDNGGVIKIMRRLDSFKHRLSRRDVTFGVIEWTINESIVHVTKGMEKQSPSDFNPEPIFKLRDFLNDQRIRKIANPKMSEKEINYFKKRFFEDYILAYACIEGKFKAVAGQDEALKERLGSKLYLTSDKVFDATLY